MGWPVPIYELALMTAARAQDMNIELSITIATPEPAPLAIFGRGASEAVGQLLKDNGIVTIISAQCEVPEPDRVAINPGARHLSADRIVAMPELHGPSVPGVPGGPVGGFIPVGVHCKVPGIERVWAAGDATDFAIEHGGIAAQQADVATSDRRARRRRARTRAVPSGKWGRLAEVIRASTRSECRYSASCALSKRGRARVEVGLA